MSNESFSAVVAVPPSHLQDIDTEGQFSRFFRDFGENSNSYFLSGFSRSCWFERVMSLLIINSGNEILKTLSGQEWTIKFDDECGDETLVSILQGSDINNLIEGLQKLFLWCASNMEKVEEIIGDGHGVDAVSDYFNSAQPLSSPNEADYAEDGNWPSYLFSFLKKLLEILSYADLKGLSIIYKIEQPCGGGAVKPLTKEQICAQLKESYQYWNKVLGEEVGPRICREDGCEHLCIMSSIRCRAHHYETQCKQPWPFKDFA